MRTLYALFSFTGNYTAERRLIVLYVVVDTCYTAAVASAAWLPRDTKTQAQWHGMCFVVLTEDRLCSGMCVYSRAASAKSS